MLYKQEINDLLKDLQDYLFTLTDAGKNRSAHKLKQMLSAMFDVICEDSPSIPNPTKKLVLTHYEVKKGMAFTKEEEYLNSFFAIFTHSLQAALSGIFSIFKRGTALRGKIRETMRSVIYFTASLIGKMISKITNGFTRAKYTARKEKSKVKNPQKVK